MIGREGWEKCGRGPRERGRKGRRCPGRVVKGRKGRGPSLCLRGLWVKLPPPSHLFFCCVFYPNVVVFLSLPTHTTLLCTTFCSLNQTLSTFPSLFHLHQLSFFPPPPFAFSSHSPPSPLRTTPTFLSFPSLVFLKDPQDSLLLWRCDGVGFVLSCVEWRCFVLCCVG